MFFFDVERIDGIKMCKKICGIKYMRDKKNVIKKYRITNKLYLVFKVMKINVLYKYIISLFCFIAYLIAV